MGTSLMLHGDSDFFKDDLHGGRGSWEREGDLSDNETNGLVGERTEHTENQTYHMSSNSSYASPTIPSLWLIQRVQVLTQDRDDALILVGILPENVLDNDHSLLDHVCHFGLD